MIIELPNGQELEFPDDTPQDVMRSAIANKFPEYAPKKSGEEGWSQALKKVAADYASAGKGALKSLANLGEFVGNIPRYGAEFLYPGQQVFGNVNLKQYLPFDTDESKLSTKEKILEGVPEFIGAAALPGLSIEKAAIGAPAGVTYLRDALRGSEAFKQALPQALYAASQAPEGQKASQGLEAGALVGSLSKIPSLSSIKNKLVSSLSPLKPEELKDAARIVRGTETSLGDVIENPTLKKQYENVIANIPMSGANQAMQRTAENITKRGTGILENLSAGADTGNVGQKLKDALNEAKIDTWTQKQAKFNAVNKEAEKSGVTTNQQNYLETAKKELDKINSSPQLRLHADPSTTKLLSNIVDEGATPESLKNMDLLRGKLGEKANTASISGDGELASIYKNLKTATEKDIESAINSSGNDKLKSLRDEAHEFYKKEWVPYKEPEIQKFTTRGGDADTLMESFIKNSKKSDRGNLLDKLTNKLKPEDRDLLAYSYFSNAIKEGQFDPLKFKTLYKQLGDRQKNSLFGGNKEMINQLDDYTKLVGKNTKGLTLMLNPLTGAQNTAQVPWKSLTAGAAVGGPVGAALGAGATMAGSNLASRALQSEGLREGLINQLIKSKEAKKTYMNVNPFIDALMQFTRDQKY